MKTCITASLVFLAIICQGRWVPAADRELDWIFLENDHIKVGLLKSHGGAIGWLSRSGSKANVLNHFDHGRLIQQSYYGDEDGSLWGKNSWRYNPVQGGDYKGKAAEVVEITSDKTSAKVRTIPRHWASGELLRECEMTQSLKLNGELLEVNYGFTYRGEKAHAARHQELPAVFVDARLATLVHYAGDQPWTGGEVSRRTPGWPNEYIQTTEAWVAYVDESGQGLGVFVPAATEATCYRFQGRGDSSCSYVAPIKTFALTPGLEFSYTAWFTLGDVPTIRERFRELRLEQASQQPATNP